MFKINVLTDRDEEFGVLVKMHEGTEEECYGISRHIGNPATFETEADARYEKKRWERNTMCDHFGFEIVEI